jgi:hypothetical protein
LARNSDRVAHAVGLACHVVPRNPDLAVVWLEQGGEDPHHRGLARPVGSEEREDAAPLNGHVDTVEDDVVAEGHAYVDRGDRG